MIKLLVLTALLSLLLTSPALGQEEGEDAKGWWSGFKQRVKGVLSRWRDDLRALWTDVLAKADDMRGWTRELFEAFKLKFKEWVEERKELPQDEKNEIEDFISKLQMPTEVPDQKNRKKIDP